MRAIAAEIPQIAATALGKRGFGEAQLVTQWDAVMGTELAGKLAPDRLSFSRGERSEGTLRLRVASAFAVEAQHLEPVIIERINGFFGYRAVARIILVQGPTEARGRAGAAAASALSAAEQGALDQGLAAMPDSELRQALRRLGTAVVSAGAPEAGSLASVEISTLASISSRLETKYAEDLVGTLSPGFGRDRVCRRPGTDGWATGRCANAHAR